MTSGNMFLWIRKVKKNKGIEENCITQLKFISAFA